MTPELPPDLDQELSMLMFGISKVSFWRRWCAALAITGFLLAVHWNHSPFHAPRLEPMEAAVVFLALMFVRWLTIASLIMAVAQDWALQRDLRPLFRNCLVLVTYILHALFGAMFVMVWISWMDPINKPTRSGEIAMAGSFFGLPSIALLALAILALTRPRQRSAVSWN